MTTPIPTSNKDNIFAFICACQETEPVSRRRQTPPLLITSVGGKTTCGCGRKYEERQGQAVCLGRK